ncbi:hypothetical protein ACWER9_06710 [Micromonospora sp. NPDC003944]
MSLTQDLLTAGAFLVPIGAAAVGLHLLGRRDQSANEYDLWAPHDDEPADELVPRRHIPTTVTLDNSSATFTPRVRPAATWQAANPSLGRRVRPDAALTGPVGLAAWEPEPVRWGGPTPPLARALLIEQAVPTLSDAAVRGIAHDYLREIGEAEQARAGIRPVVSPATARDFTGAFAVLAVA